MMRLQNANSTCTAVAAARMRRKERLAAAPRRRACIVTATRSCRAVSLRTSMKVEDRLECLGKLTEKALLKTPGMMKAALYDQSGVSP
jgi:hypothetical protein